MKKTGILSILGLILIVSLFLILKEKPSIGKQINVYGYLPDLTIEGINPNDCVLKVIRVQNDSIFIDTCYAIYDELMQEFEKNGENMKLNFNRSNFNKHLALRNTTSIFQKLYRIPTNKLKQMENEIKEIGCDSAFGFDVEVIEGESVELIEFRDSGSCTHTYSKFINDLKEEFNQKIENWY